MDIPKNQLDVDDNTGKSAMNEQLEGIGWAALLIASGTIWLLPEAQVPRGSWLVAVGVILLGLNAVRAAYGIRLNGFSTGAGFLALLAGLSDFYQFKLPLFPIVLILIGAVLLMSALRAKGKASTIGHDWCCGWQEDQDQDRAHGSEPGH